MTPKETQQQLQTLLTNIAGKFSALHWDPRMAMNKPSVRVEKQMTGFSDVALGDMQRRGHLMVTGGAVEFQLARVLERAGLQSLDDVMAIIENQQKIARRATRKSGQVATQSAEILSYAEAKLIRDQRDRAITSGASPNGHKEFSEGWLEQNLGANWDAKLASTTSFKEATVGLASGEPVYEVTMENILRKLRVNHSRPRFNGRSA